MRTDSLHASAAPVFSDHVAPGISSELDRWALRRIHQAIGSGSIRLALWDGYELSSNGTPVISTILIKNRQALYRWLWAPELNFGEAYMFGAVEVLGDLPRTLEEVYRTMTQPARWDWVPSWGSNDRREASDNVHRHYDLGNDFYELWLDREMVYTCAYFPRPECSLEEAQLAKMDLVCRKLRLRPGDRVIEAGCGWGALALFMARQYGVTVRAFNISAEQIAYAQSRAIAAQITDRVEFIEDDYRNVHGRCDAFVSVGMLEHVGLPDYRTLGQVIDRVLTASGRGLLHFNGRNQHRSLNPWIRKRIFPGAYPPTLREVLEHVLEPQAFSVLDVENLRLHYAKTLEHWRKRFTEAADRITASFSPSFVRAWDLYLAGSQAAFTTGSMQLFQVLFARGTSNAIPWTRREV
jgi:cyclopropane-fatty-acyl-phospholipid synthase